MRGQRGPDMEVRNETRRKLLADEPVFGVWIQSMSPRVAEVVAQTDLDWVGIDMEHTTIGARGTEDIVRAVEGSGVDPIVRLPSLPFAQAGGAKRALDAGARGVIIPRIESAEEAEDAVRTALFPPDGDRGVAGSVRANDHGASFDDYVAAAPDETLIVVQIETATGADNAEAILGVPRIDAVLIGENDLSATHGTPGDHALAAVREDVEHIVRSARAHDVRPGAGARDPERLAERRADGYRFFLLGGDLAFVRDGLTERLDFT